MGRNDTDPLQAAKTLVSQVSQYPVWYARVSDRLSSISDCQRAPQFHKRSPASAISNMNNNKAGNRTRTDDIQLGKLKGIAAAK